MRWTGVWYGRLGRVFDFSIGGSFTFKRNIKYVTKLSNNPCHQNLYPTGCTQQRPSGHINIQYMLIMYNKKMKIKQ